MSGHTLGDIAQEIGARLEGLAERAVRSMASLEEAGPSELCYAESPKLFERVRRCAAAGVIVGEDFPPLPSVNLLRVRDVKIGSLRAMELFRADRRIKGVHHSAMVADDARIGDNVGIGPLVVIESGAVIGARSQLRAGCFVGQDTQIGADCDIGPNAVLLEGTVLGNRCILHPGVVLGADGYGYHWLDDHHHKIPQLGVVVLEDDVEIGANTCIDRATMGETRIGRGSKFDNLVHVGHSNRIGEHVLLTGQVGVANGSRLGNGVVAGGQAGIANNVSVADGVQIGAGGGVIGDVTAGQKVWGTPARPMTQVMREQAALGKLPELLRAFRRQEKELAQLRDRIASLEGRPAE